MNTPVFCYNKHMKYYTLTNILKQNADYNIIVGERSNGKTYSTLKYGIEQYWKHGYEIAYIRRLAEDLKASKASVVFSALCADGVISKITGGEYTGVKYYRGAWYLTNTEGSQENPFCYAFALSQMERYKSLSYPKVYTIIFDEFLTRLSYLPDEFNLFMNTLSTIIRQRDGIKIFMLGNTVNKYAPYFKEMNLPVEGMNAGDIKIITRDTDKKGVQLKIAVEYTTPTPGGKKSDKYFQFNAKSVRMITGGAWEVADYPKCPVKYSRNEILFHVFLVFDNHYIAADFVNKGAGNMFLFWYPKKIKGIKRPDTDIVYCDYSSYRFNYYSNITRPRDDIGRMIARLFIGGKIFYSDNETGEILRNYIQYSVKSAGMVRA